MRLFPPPPLRLFDLSPTARPRVEPRHRAHLHGRRILGRSIFLGLRIDARLALRCYFLGASVPLFLSHFRFFAYGDSARWHLAKSGAFRPASCGAGPTKQDFEIPVVPVVTPGCISTMGAGLTLTFDFCGRQ